MEKGNAKGKIDRKIERTTTDKTTNNKRNDKEKKESTAQKTVPILIVVSISLAIILIATLIGFYQLKKDSKQNAKVLESVYASSYFSMVDNINNLQVDANKFETLSDANAQRMSLNSMEQDCQSILAGLAVLPIEAQNCMSATKFFNQINGLCEAYINSINDGKVLTQKEISIVSDVGYVLGNIKEQFNIHNTMVRQAGYNFIDASVFNSKGVNEFTNTIGKLNSSAIDYPSMIFDGPFSDSLLIKEVNGLSESEVSNEEARTYLIDNVFKGQNPKIKYLGNTKGGFETYNFECEIENYVFSVQVTKRDGKLLTLSSYAEKGESVMSKSETIELAETFCKNAKYENMKSVWYEEYENLAYINLAPIIDEIIYYPDLIKVKVDLSKKTVIGFEAQNYCYNHVTRNVKSTIGIESAKTLIDGDYIIREENLAVIPIDSGDELLCYEFICEGLDGNYYFYVDANNKIIIKILKIVLQNNINKLI